MNKLNPKTATESEMQAHLDNAPEGFVADDALVNRRTKVCNTCKHKTTTAGIDRCGECHCVIWFKTRLAHTKCPVGKW